MWCSNCGKDYGEGVTCPECGREGMEMPALEWGKSQLPGELLNKWPKDGKGQPEKAVYLTHRTFLGMEDEMTVNLLQAYDIPVLRRYPNDGDFGILQTISGKRRSRRFTMRHRSGTGFARRKNGIDFKM